MWLKPRIQIACVVPSRRPDAYERQTCGLQDIVYVIVAITAVVASVSGVVEFQSHERPKRRGVDDKKVE